MPPKQASESETYSISSYPKVELLSPIAPPDALAAASSSVELLSPLALHDALAAAFYGFRLVGSPVTVIYSADRLGTIDLHSQRRRLTGSRLFGSPVTVTYSADRLGTIDLH